MPGGFVGTVMTRVTMKASVLVAMTTVSKRSAEAWYVALDSRFLCRPVRRLKALCGQCGRRRGCVGVNLCMVVHEQVVSHMHALPKVTPSFGVQPEANLDDVDE